MVPRPLWSGFGVTRLVEVSQSMSKETLLLGTGDSAGHPKSGQGIVPCLLGERAVNE
jgi:hypothetical protein